MSPVQRDILLDLATLMSQRRTVAEVFETFAARLLAVADFDRAVLFVNESDARFVRIVAAYPSALNDQKKDVFRASEIGLPWLEHEPVGTEFDPGSLDFPTTNVLAGAGYRRCWAISLAVDGVAYGAYSVAKKSAAPFRERDIQFLVAASKLIAAAVRQDVELATAARQTARSNLLNELALLLNAGESVDGLFDRILALLERALEFDYVGLLVATESADELRMVGSRPEVVRSTGSVTTLRDIGLDGTGQDMLQYRADRATGGNISRFREAGIVRICTALLRQGSETVGVFTLGRRENRSYSPAEMEFVQTLANLLGQALASQQRRERTEAEARRARLLNELALLLNAGESVEALFDRLPRLLRQAIPFEYVGLAIVNGEDQRMRAIEWDARSDSVRGDWVSRELIQFDEVAALGTTVRELNLQPYRGTMQAIFYARGFRRSAVVLLQHDGEALGVLHVSREGERPFEPEQIAFLQVVATFFAQTVAGHMRIAESAAETAEQWLRAEVAAVAAARSGRQAIIAGLVEPLSMIIPELFVAFTYPNGESVMLSGPMVAEQELPFGPHLRRALDEGQVVLYEAQPDAAPETLATIRILGVRAIAVTAARVGGMVVGLLITASRKRGFRFSERDLRLINQVAEITGPAMANALAAENAEVEAKEQVIITAVAAVAARESDPAQLVSALVGPLRTFISKPFVAYAHLEGDVCAYQWPGEGEIRLPMTELEKRARSEHQVAVSGLEEQLPADHPGRQFGIHSGAITACLSGGTAVGLLVIGSRDSEVTFSKRDLRLFHLMAQIVGPAMQSARANAATARQERVYNLILSSLSEAVVLLDHELRTVFANEHGMELIERIDPERRLRTVEEHLPQLPVQMREQFSQATRARVPSRGRTRVMMDGEEHWYDYELVPLDHPNFRLVVVAADVTPEVRQQRELEEHQQQMTQASRLAALGELIGGVAHELNNPLTAILGFSEVMARSDAGMALSEELDIVRQEALRARNIVRDLLFIARPGPIEQQRVDLAAVVAHIERLRRSTWRRNGIDVEIRLPQEECELWGNENQLTQVLLNLVTNAEYAVRDTVVKRVSIRVEREGVNTVLQVTDTGHGMDKATASRVFEPFFTTKQHHGTGLGLSLSYTMVAAHQGRIELHSEPGKGSRFRVILPPHEPAPAGEIPPLPTERGRPARVLVVDDEPSLRKVCQRLIASMGHECAVAEDRAAALAFVEQGPFDLVLCDYRLASETADALIAILNAKQPDLLRRTVIATGATSDAGVLDLVKRYDLELIGKPYGFAEISKLLATLEWAS